MNKAMMTGIPIKSLSTGLLTPVLLAIFTMASPALLARDAEDSPHAYSRYVVELLDSPLALYEGDELSVTHHNGSRRLAATATKNTGNGRLNVRSEKSRDYLQFLSGRHTAFDTEVRTLLGRMPEVSHRFRNATNGMALLLTADEADLLAESPLVRSISPEVTYRLDTYAGPHWLGARVLWTAQAGFPAARGEGVVVGNIDTGINWDHPSFDDSDYAYVNPHGSGLGLCSDAEVLCNDKLIGVYDFVEDDPTTADFVEESTKGKDTDGHGSHTAATAVGKPLNITLNDAISTTLSGVAPRAQLVSYRVCYQDEDGGAPCQGAAILKAIDQAVADGVDVINYSIGGDPRDPWGGGTADRAFLAARAAGILVASSAGNTGPNEATVTSPAMAPWVIAVANATHNNILGSRVENFSGGSLPAPDPMVGATRTNGTSKKVIVHAKNYGNALCGTGDPELQPTCASNTGASNPWAGTTPFNGEIVVCDRGTYGRVEKGKNLLQAGAGGYILANTAEQGESIEADDHCLPGTHIGQQDGDELRTWLDAGSGHGAQLSGLMLAESDATADQLSFSSSRGPALQPVQDTLKPNLIAPGTGIVAAGSQGESLIPLSGTSMASPHIAGSVALIKSVHPDWNASQIVSAIEMTATQELAKNEDGQPATTEQVGAGRPQLGEAANAGLYLDVSSSQFTQANPSIGGQPRDLNLPGVVSAECKASCSFTRRVTDMMGGGSWTVTPVDFPAGTDVTVTPANFSLSNGSSQSLDIAVNVEDSGVVGDWVSGKIRLSAAGSADLYLTVSVFSYGGDLPEKWTISTDGNGGSTVFGLTGLVALPNATFTAGGPVKPQSRPETLVEDPTNDDPFDAGEGTFTQILNLPNGALWLYAETPASTAVDIDLFVGRDEDGDNRADDWEELCSSTTPQDVERCDLYDLPPGTYWIHVQNWTGSNTGGDDVILNYAAIETGGGLAASGAGIIDEDVPFPVKVSWDNFDAAPGETQLAAVGIGSNKNWPNNVGVIPVEISRTGVAEARTFPLMNGMTHGLALAGNTQHDRMFIDVPVGADSLTVSASGDGASQSDALTLELVRMEFDDSIDTPPFASAANGPVETTATGSGGVGPTATITGGVQPGRWYAVLTNGVGIDVSVEITADVTFSGEPVDVHPGLWFPRSRPEVGQGYDYNWGGTDRALIWYTYDEAGQPAWYIAGAPANSGNIWTSDIYRVTNDGSSQQLAPVGKLSVTALAREDAMFSYTLFGESGSERMMPLSTLTCPQVDGSAASYTGIWFKGVEGLGGASVLVNDSTQAQIHYLFDAAGLPRWLFAQNPDFANATPFETEIPILQYHGYCAVCDAADVGFVEVGTLGRSFSGEASGSWTLDYSFDTPLSGTVNRTDQVIKLTQRLICQ
jgi:subtilisin family serine protease